MTNISQANLRTAVEQVRPILLPLDAARQLVGLPRSTFYREVANGNIPRPLKMGRKSLWKLADIEQFAARLGA